MPDDIDSVLTLLRHVLEHLDTGYVRIPPELVGVKAAAPRYGVSERTLRRDCKEHGIALLEGKTYLVVVPAADAFYGNDTGPLHHAQYDIRLIRKLTGWPIRPSTACEPQVIPVVWDELDTKESRMQIGFAPSQRYPETVKLHIPAGMSATLQYVARRRAQSTSDWIRQALLDRLHQEGLVVLDTGAVRRREEL